MDFTNCSLDITSVFKEIKDFRYFATKINTPFFDLEKPFPEMYPVGRDVDIITHPDDFECIVKAVDKFCKSQNMYHRIVYDSETHQRHRLESNEFFLLPNAVRGDKLRNGLPLTKLHFQFDVSSVLEEEYQTINILPLVKNMDNPIFKNGVKILSDTNEALLRCAFYAKSRSLHHREFIYRNRDFIEYKYVVDKSVWDAIRPVIS